MSRLLPAGRYHFCASFNMEPGRARWVRGDVFATKVREALSAIQGVTFVTAPQGTGNPEAALVDLEMPLTADRGVWSVDVWVNLAAGVNSSAVATAFATALRNAGAGNDWPTENVAAAMERCANPIIPRDLARRTGATAGASVLTGPLGTIVGESLTPNAFERVCLTIEAYAGAPPARSGIDGAAGRAIASPVRDSSNPQRIGQREPIFTIPGINWPFTAAELKVTLYVVGGLVALGIIGYTARGIAQVMRES